MISVCMATYNGERYIHEQIDSILSQLGKNDELLISDDGSKDNTIQIIQSIIDPRIKILKNGQPHGVVHNFENALREAKGDYIILADQDDVWQHNRVAKAVDILKDGRFDCVTSNRVIIDANGIRHGGAVMKQDFTSFPFWKVLWHNPYIGCCMAFTRKHLDLVLPFPDKLPMHDLWIGLLAHKQGTSAFIEEPLIMYRRHGENVTTGKSPFSVFGRIKYRMRLLIQLYARLKKHSQNHY